jgi:hypothetical protein
MGRGLGDSLESFANDVLIPIGSFGTLGVDESGALEAGFGLENIDEAVGELSGRNQQREALAQANDRATEEEANRATLLEQEQERARILDVQASQAAGTLRAGTSNRSGAANLRSATIAEDGDFLGL